MDLDIVKYAVYAILLYLLVRVSMFLSQMVYSFVLPKLGLGCNLRKYGEWAVVTGATDGIGKEYALQLAERGFSIVLISRSKDKLDKVAEEIISKYKVMTKTITYDFSKTDGYDMIENQLKGLDIGILVNNVGAGDPNIIGHEDCDLNSVFKTLKINIFSAVAMTHIATKMMTHQKRGLIIHISSFSIEVSVPFFACYAASKVFLHKFSQCLSFDHGGIVHHQVVAPGYVSTKLNGLKESTTVPTPYVFVRSALGTAGRLFFTHGYWAHDLLSFLYSFLPEKYFTTYVMNVIKEGRKGR